MRLNSLRNRTEPLGGEGVRAVSSEDPVRKMWATEWFRWDVQVPECHRYVIGLRVVPAMEGCDVVVGYEIVPGRRYVLGSRREPSRRRARSLVTQIKAVCMQPPGSEPPPLIWRSFADEEWEERLWPSD